MLWQSLPSPLTPLALRSTCQGRMSTGLPNGVASVGEDTKVERGREVVVATVAGEDVDPLVVVPDLARSSFDCLT